MAVTRRWWEKWLSSLDSKLTFDEAIAGDESFVLVLRDMGLGVRERLAREVSNAFVLAPPAVLSMWEGAFTSAHALPPGLLSIHKLHQLGEKDLQLLNDKTLIVEAPVSDTTRAKERLAGVCFHRRTIVYVHFTLGAPHKPPRELSTALKIVNRGRAPVQVVWEPPIEGDLGQALYRVGLVGVPGMNSEGGGSSSAAI
jgi:hypothetical protein